MTTSSVDAMPALAERTSAPTLAEPGPRKPRAKNTFHAGAGVAKAGTCGSTTKQAGRIPTAMTDRSRTATVRRRNGVNSTCPREEANPTAAAFTPATSRPSSRTACRWRTAAAETLLIMSVTIGPAVHGRGP